MPTPARADLLLAGDLERRWRLTISGAGIDARLSATYTASCGGRLHLAFRPLLLREAPRRLSLSSTPGTRFEVRADGLVAIEEAVLASRELMAHVMRGSLETLAPGVPCRDTRRHRRRL